MKTTAMIEKLHFYALSDEHYAREDDDIDVHKIIDELKALEIIKTKKVNARDFYIDFCHTLASIGYKQYVEYYDDWSDELMSEEEFNLVRKVLS